jgi:small subunit ribosomal protein S9
MKQQKTDSVSKPDNLQAKGIGRRKSSTAEVVIKPGQGVITINQKPCQDYMLKNTHLVLRLKQCLTFLELEHQLDLDVQVMGGGYVSQADAIQHGASRALCVLDSKFRPSLKLKGYLRRDARVKERKKYGLKKARKAPQFSKR